MAFSNRGVDEAGVVEHLPGTQPGCGDACIADVQPGRPVAGQGRELGKCARTAPQHVRVRRFLELPDQFGQRENDVSHAGTDVSSDESLSEVVGAAPHHYAAARFSLRADVVSGSSGLPQSLLGGGVGNGRNMRPLDTGPRFRAAQKCARDVTDGREADAARLLRAPQHVHHRRLELSQPLHRTSSAARTRCQRRRTAVTARVSRHSPSTTDPGTWCASSACGSDGGWSCVIAAPCSVY